MVKIRIELARKDRKKLDKLIDDKGTRKKIFKEILRMFDKEGLILAGFIARNYLSNQRLGRVTGNLARSMLGKADLHNGLPSLRVGIFRGPALAYAGIHEFGGTILPKKAKALAWPVGFRGKDPKSPSDFPKDALRFIPFRRGTVAVGALYNNQQYKIASRQEGFTLRDIDPLFVLLRKVVVTEKRYLRDGLKEYTPVLAKRLADIIVNNIAQ
jgi:hypothetical protein